MSLNIKAFALHAGKIITIMLFLVSFSLLRSQQENPRGPVAGGAVPGPLPLFPANNWWNVDISGAPVDPGSANYISFIGVTRGMHPDFGGEAFPGSQQIYGMPYAIVDGDQPKRSVQFYYSAESDGVDHGTGQSVPFYPIPDEAITQAHWIEGGEPGNVDLRGSQDRHLLMLDRDNRCLYELYNVFFDGYGWQAGSGAFFDLDANGRRPESWTSADAAGLSIMAGLVRHDEAFGTDEIGHAFRVTVRATNGYVYPASHAAGSRSGALPMGARLRLKAGRDISGFVPEVQKIFRAMKKYGLIVADNGSDLYITGTYDLRWNNDLLNPAFASIKGADFEVVELGWRPGGFMRGDPDANARIDPRDLLILDAYLAGRLTPGAAPFFSPLASGDVDASGAVDQADWNQLAQFLVGNLQ
jgi:hypothetical protein